MIAHTDTFLLLPDLGKNFRVVSKVLETVDQATTHRVLRSKEEGKYNLSHLVVAKIFPALVPWLSHNVDPFVQHTLRLTTFRHSDLAFVGSKLEPLHNHFPSLDSLVNFCSRKRNGKVDELEGQCDEPVLVINFFDGGVRNVITTEYAKGGFHIHVTSYHHDGFSVRVSGGLL
jgi:hypothetical protein